MVDRYLLTLGKPLGLSDFETFNMTSEFNMKTRRDFLKSLMAGSVAALVPSVGFAGSVVNRRRKPNVVMIVCDDLNDYVSGMAGHPQTRTPHIARLAQSGVAFKRLSDRNLPTHLEKPFLGQVVRKSRAQEFQDHHGTLRR